MGVMGVGQSVANVVTRGTISADNMEHANQQGQGAGFFDVYTHTVDGLSQQMEAAINDPASALLPDREQEARIRDAMAIDEWESSSFEQWTDSAIAQGDSLRSSLDAIGDADGALATVGATFSFLTGIEQMISTMLSVIPFPAFPAMRILDMDVGLPHGHSHPPNLVPPAPLVPLPSTGPIIPIPLFSGASKTLINGMPAARCGDMGLGIWCGGYFPMYEIFLGSSNVWIEGARAARVAIDITKHCMFTTPKPQDLPIGPMVGMTVSSSMNVLIGGVPMPSLLSLGLGAALRGLGSLLGKGARAIGRATQGIRNALAKRLGLPPGFLRCKILRAEPVNVVTGEVVIDQQDFSIPGRIPLEWDRHYGSASSRIGVCGYGWETPADIRLEISDDGSVILHRGGAGAAVFPELPNDKPVMEFVDGAVLTRQKDYFLVQAKGGLTYFFRIPKQQTSEFVIDSIVDLHGNYLSFVRDELGLKQIKESAGRHIEVISKNGLIQEMWLYHPDENKPKNLVKYEHDPDTNDLVAVYDTLNNPYRFQYRNHCCVQHIDRNGLSFYYEYDAHSSQGRCVHTWGDGGLYDYRLRFNSLKGETEVTNSLGHTSLVEYNDLFQVVKEVDPLNGVTVYEYDEVGRTTAVVDPDGNRTEFVYDPSGNLTRLTRPDGTVIETEFDAASKPVRITDPNGTQCRQKWDSRGLLLEQTAPLGNVSRYEYDGRGQLVALINPRGARSEFAFDAFGNLTTFKDPLGHDTRFTYDVLANINSKLDPLDRKTIYLYDAKSRLTDVRLPSGAAVRCVYDAEDNLIHYVDENGSETRLEYFGQGEIAQRIQANGHNVKYHYDTEEQLIGVTNQRGETYHLKRDALGRIVKEVDYWGQVRTYSYSSCGHIQRSIDPLGRVTAYDTDPLGRVLKKSLPDPDGAKAPFEESFEYDANGNLTVCANRYIRIEREFDPEGRMTIEKQGEDFVIRNAYNEVGNRILRETALKQGEATVSHQVSYTYDALEQAVGITIDDNPPIEIQRDAVGRIVAGQLSSSLRWEMDYSADGYLTRQRVRKDAKPVVEVAYSYDAAGNLTERRDAESGIDKYAYDPVGRITVQLDPQGKLKHYLNDPAGDRLVTRIIEGGRPKAAAAARRAVDHEWLREREYEGALYRFDRCGNLVYRNDGRRDLTLRWDTNQRLIESCMNGMPTRYRYDPLGRRIEKRTGDERTEFTWDGDALLGDRIESTNGWIAPPNSQYREWILYPNTFEPLVLVHCVGVTKPSNTYVCEYQLAYYQNDLNGCPNRLLDHTGATVWEATYDALSAIKGLRKQIIDNPLRLQGQYHDRETGFCYSRHRYFDPIICSFISHDPLRLWAGEDLYGFPPNIFKWIDPLGLICRRVRDLIDKLRRGGANVEVKTMKEARELLDNMPELRPHTFDRRLPVPGLDDAGPSLRGLDWNKPGHSNPYWRQPNGTYRGDLVNKAAPGSPIHPDLPGGHPHRTNPHYNIRNHDGSKSAIIITG